MIKFARLMLQFGLMPPININFNFPPWRHRPPPPQAPPPRPVEVPTFNPAQRVNPLQGRLLAASNALKGYKPR